MSAKPLCSKGQCDKLSLPYTTNKGKGKGKRSSQTEMEQQQQPSVQLSSLRPQPIRPASAQHSIAESATPTSGLPDRSSSTPLQDAGMMPLPLVNTVPPARLGTLQVSSDNLNTQDSGSHMSQMSGPLFTEDRLSSSSLDADACDTEVLNITQRCTPSEALTVIMSPRLGSHSTVDYSTQGDQDQQVQLPGP